MQYVLMSLSCLLIRDTRSEGIVTKKSGQAKSVRSTHCDVVPIKVSFLVLWCCLFV